MKHIWSVLCRHSQIDADSNNISLHEVFEQIVINIPPHKTQPNLIIPLEYELVSFWIKESNDEIVSTKYQINVFDPNGKIINNLTGDLKINKQYQRIRTRSKIYGLKVTKPGIYYFRVYVLERNNIFKQVAEIPLQVAINETKKVQSQQNFPERKNRATNKKPTS